MRRFYFVFTLAIMVLAVASCKKDNVPDGSNEDLNAHGNNKVTSILLDFKQTLKHKSTGTLIADSAEWYLEGLLNLEQANNSHEFGRVDFYHDTLIVNLIGNQVSLVDLNNLYSAISDWVNNIKQSKNNESYTFDIINLSFEETGLKNGDKNLAVSLSGGLIGYIPNYVPFDSTDYWYWCCGMGKCGDYTGQYIGRDATTELQFKFRHPLVVEPTGYFVSVQSSLAMFYDYMDNENPFGQYMMFYRSGYGPNVPDICPSPDELNYYLNKFDYIKTSKAIPGKTFSNVEVGWSHGVALPYWEAMHYYTLYFGEKIENPK
ncbi:MAG: hypothetical protein K0B15_05575 [Lentimicrobium sp.]|nr:hypothetical protein [Lentimicrobium sp.]